MSWCDAVVVDVLGDQAWVELSEQVAGCGSCRNAGTCAEGMVGGARPRRYRLSNTIGAGVGDRVQLDIAPGTLWRAALASYVLPLLLALAGAAAGQAIAGDAWAIVGLALGLGAGLFLLRRREMRARRDQNLISLRFPSRDIRFEVAK